MISTSLPDVDPVVGLAHAAAPRVVSRGRRTAGAVLQAGDWIFGAGALVVGLSVIATIPLVQLLSLGYLLEASGRVVRSGHVGDGFVGVRQAARLGRVATAALVLMTPLWFAASLRDSARLIDPGSRAARGWTIAAVAIAVVIAFQFVTGCLRGAKLRHFLIPRPLIGLKLLCLRDAYPRLRDGLWNFAVSLRLPHYFWLGLRGFAGALVWLVLPVGMLAVSSSLHPPAAQLVGLTGGVLLAVVLLYLPFLQAWFAAQNRWRAMFEIGFVRRSFRRAPVAYWIALVFTLALALPLYLLKIELVPREAAWLPSLLFVVSIFPARLLVGWALARSLRRRGKRLWLVRWLSRLAMLPVVALYVLLVYFTQYLSWYGTWSLLEQHVLLVPAPFLGY